MKIMKNKHKGILSHDSGATDPILIIAGIAITLILLVGGTFAVAGFMNNARDLNAKADLDRVATAQTAAMAASDAYQPLAKGPKVRTGKADATLATGGIGFVPSDGTTVVVAVGATGWAALAESSSGSTFLRTSQSNATIKVDAGHIREDFLIEALEGRIVDAGASATSVGDAQVVKFPADVSVYNLTWTWVDTVWGLPADSRPAPGAHAPDKTPTPGDGGTPGGEQPGGGTTNPPVEPEPTPDPEPVIPPFPAETALSARLGNPFSSTTLDNVAMVTSTLAQGHAGEACVYVDFTGRGTTGWSVSIDPSSVLFNYDLDPTHYTSNQFMKFDRVGDRIVMTAKSDTGYMGKLDKGKKYQAQICNKQVPLLPTTLVDSTSPTTSNTAKWEKKVTVSTAESSFYLSWKIRIDFTDVVEKFGMQPDGFKFNKPGTGTGTVTVTHVGGNIYEFVGSGSGVDIKKDKPANFTIYPK